MKLTSNGGVLNGSLQVLHVHVFSVAPLGASHMAEPGTYQHESRVAVREAPNHTGTAADLPVQTFQHVGGRNLSCVQLREGIKRQRILQAVFQAADGFGKTVLILSADFFGQSAGLLPGRGQPDRL